MDVKRTTQTAWLFSLVLAFSLGELSQAKAEEAAATDAVVSDSEVTTTVFITDDVEPEPPSPPQSVAGDLVFIEDTPAIDPPTVSRVQQPMSKPVAMLKPLPAKIQPKTIAMPQMPVASGELKVITNHQITPKLTAKRSLTPQQPLAPIASPAMPPQSTVEPVANMVERDQPGDIQMAVHGEPMQSVASPAVAPAAKLLLEAHQLSLQAEASSEYTQIIDNCAAALQYDLQSDQQDFARNLQSWALNRRGQNLSDEGEQELANADFQAALEYNPRNWRALHNRGVSYAQTNSFAEAFDDFNNVIQLNPSYAKAYANRATLYVQAKDLHSAIGDYQQAIKYDAKFATAYVGLGRVCHMLGRWDDALIHLTKAIELDPESPEIVCSRGDLQSDMGLYGEALSDYARTIELDSEFAHAYRNGAWLLATCPDERFRDPENAVMGAQQALEYSYGEKHVALDTLAAALASNGQFSEAVDTVKQAVDLAPEEAKYSYLSRMQLYQEQQPFLTEPVDDVAQVVYEASDEE